MTLDLIELGGPVDFINNRLYEVNDILKMPLTGISHRCAGIP